MKEKLHYTEVGEGFPLVMLHGNGQDHSYFKRQIEPFSAAFRLILPDTRGHGASPRGEAPFTIVQFAEDLKALLDELQIEKCHLLGFSDGGNVALQFALKYPEYIERLVLNGANLNPSGVKREVQMPFEARWCELKNVSPRQGELFREWELLDLMVTQPALAPQDIAGLSLPTLIVAGEDDMIDEAHTRRMAEAIPGSRLVILPGDHFVARRNWQAFNPVVLEFLRGKRCFDPLILGLSQSH